jgi:hypothetical protein
MSCDPALNIGLDARQIFSKTRSVSNIIRHIYRTTAHLTELNLERQSQNARDRASS